MRNPNLHPNDEDINTIMRHHFYICDDKTHDSYFVQHCLFLHWEDIVKDGFKPKQHQIWFNGHGFQFKRKIPFYFVNHYPYLIGGCNCMWSFFGLSHGKGPHDGVGAILKRFIKQVLLDVKGLQLQNAKQVVNLFCSRLNT